MKKKRYFILMADIIGSRATKQDKLMRDFKKIVHTINHVYQRKILSPLTITLGDEFQGIAIDLNATLELIIALEEQIIEQHVQMKLRYVLVEGEIDTPINNNIAYEMLGAGLTEARQMLTNDKSSNSRFHFSIQNEQQSAALNNIFNIYQSIVDDWKLEKDFELITQFLKLKDYKLVAEKLEKDRSLIWRREKTIKINEYISLKKVIQYIGNHQHV
ncbi:SatD family protein [Chitinophaga agri]|uniref:SatD family (SatD) n=1 Tax=Chitinophaga agri TaxID=2703787 RepID=A0A6B9ZLB8_9BACT|nr:SatD family protein [Chitinophaga agri]QHS63188.1 hypothetical protein GWR21_27445 [Chitinophaga agri]